MKSVSMAVLAALLVSGCGSEQTVLQYQGRPAATALECKAAYEAARERGSNTTVIAPNTGAGLAGVLLAGAIVSGVRESHYNACLARVASQPPGSAPAASGGIATSAPVHSGASTLAPGCIAGVGVLQGGTGYCVGK